MLIVVKSEYGSFEIGGGKHKKCRLVSIDGIGIPSRSATTIKFSNLPGNKIVEAPHNNRVITLSFDISSTASELTKIYRILQGKCEIYFHFGDVRRKITGYVLEETQATAIKNNALYSIVTQFYCEIPYFTDFVPNELSLHTRTDNFPTSFVQGVGYITLPAIATTRTPNVKVTNFGCVDSFPIIKIIAKEVCNTITIKNLTTNNQIVLSKALAYNEEIVFNMAERKIKSNISGSVINYITNASKLDSIYIAPGENDFLVTNDGINDFVATIIYDNLYEAVTI